MQIDFFAAPCHKIDGNCKKEGVVCKSITRNERFGICDNRSGERKPAFIDIVNEEIWDLIVRNPIKTEVTFKAIDYCVDIFRENNELIKRCEGFLIYRNKIIFIELKTGTYRGWLSDAREKLEETIGKFRENHPDQGYEIIAPAISNKRHNRIHQSETEQKRKFKDKTGLDFRVISEISFA